jgi:hypothetical protein
MRAANLKEICGFFYCAYYPFLERNFHIVFYLFMFIDDERQEFSLYFSSLYTKISRLFVHVVNIVISLNLLYNLVR